MAEPSQSTISVKILDKEYQVSCPPDEVDALKRSAEYLDKQMRDIRNNASVFGLDRIAVMAALNITNDLLRQTKIVRRLKSGSDSQLQSMSEKIDKAIDRFKAKS
jgi:cell division protein ZapA